MEFNEVFIYDYRESDEGAFMRVHIPGRYLPNGMVENVMRGNIDINDARMISNKQRGMIYALCRDIAIYSGETDGRHKVKESVEYVKQQMKRDFLLETDGEYFSLANVDMSTANRFIEYILEFCIKFGVPFSKRTAVMAKEINNYLYCCIMNDMCAACGASSEHNPTIQIVIHHCTGSRVGMGGNRNQVDHTQRELISLCGTCHTEIHNKPESEFFEKYHVAGIKLKAKDLKALGVKGRYIEEHGE